MNESQRCQQISWVPELPNSGTDVLVVFESVYRDCLYISPAAIACQMVIGVIKTRSMSRSFGMLMYVGYSCIYYIRIWVLEDAP